MRVTLVPLLLALWIAACGGGGSSSTATPDPTPTPDPQPEPEPEPEPDPEPQPDTFSLSGHLQPAGDAAIDSDTGDPTVPAISNNFTNTPQFIRNPVTVGGYVNKLSDEFDVYRVELAAGQIINLFVAEDGMVNDLDLVLADLDRNVLVTSVGTGRFESITVPGSGTRELFIQVDAFSGASNYVLTVSQPGTGGATTTQTPPLLHSRTELVPGQAIVRYADSPAGSAAAKSAPGLALARIPNGPELLDVSIRAKSAEINALDSGLGVTDPALARRLATLLTIKQLRRQPGVRHAEPNLVRRASAVPDDEFFDQQWHYPLINLPQAWDITTGTPEVIVAVADTGVRLAHVDLQNQFDPLDPDGFDFVRDVDTSLDGDGLDGNADDPGDGGIAGNSSFHGTHVAGTIAAATDNRIGVAGVAWNARIMPLRVLGEGGAGTSFDIIDAVRYAAGLANSTGQLPPRPADIINLSLGADAGSQLEQEAYLEARAAGLIIIAAAGNSGDSRLSFPASYDGVVSVAAVGRQKQRAPYSQFNAAIDVAAPGGDQSRGTTDGVLSTRASDSGGTLVDTVSYLQGTSMAAPHLAGVVALMKSVHPGLTPDDLDALLAGGGITEDLGNAGRDDAFGHGLIDANRAVRAAIELAQGAPPPDNPQLASSPTSLDFGNGLTQLTLTLANAGTGTLQITGVSDDAPWLTVSAQAAVGADGLGAYLATVNRAGLADGTYAATISVGSSVNGLQIPVLMRVGAVAGRVDAGKQYVLLVDPATNTTLFQDDVQIGADGRYAYRFDAVPPGDYLLFSGTDSDNDDFICDEGESCGAFPEIDLPLPVSVTDTDRQDVDFLVSFGLSAPTSDPQAADAPAAARPGLRRLR